MPKNIQYIAYLLCIIVSSLPVFDTASKAYSQINDVLPTDLLLTGISEDAITGVTSFELAKVDRNTLEISTFYTGPNISNVIPLAWSPNKALLAIYRAIYTVPDNQEVAQICILDQIGILKLCFEQSIPLAKQRRLFDQLNNISWSNDSHYIYFVSRSGLTVKLLQGDVVTGQTNTVIEYSHLNREILLTWPQNLTFFIAHTPYLNTPLSEVFQKLTPAGFTDLSINLPNYMIVDMCTYISPQHGLMSFLDQSGSDHSLAIIDARGNLVFKLDKNNGLGSLRLGCPIWNDDESTIYIAGNADNALNAQILKYTPATNLLEVFFQIQSNEIQINQQFDYNSPIVFFDNYVAGTSYSNTKSSQYSQVNVIYPDKHTRGFLGKYDYTTNPLWSPLALLTPLPTNTPIETIVVTSTFTNTPTYTPTSTSTSTSTPTATPTLAPTSTAGMVRLQYYPDPGRRSITVDSLEPDFRIMNPTSSAIPLSEFKIRYYFTKEGTSPLVFNCWYTSLPLRCNNITGTFVTLPTPVNGADTYLEVGFTGTTESVPANGSTGEILVGIRKQDWSNFNQSNDYSFQSRPEVFSDWDHVTLYRNGSLVWGSVPQ